MLQNSVFSTKETRGNFSVHEQLETLRLCVQQNQLALVNRLDNAERRIHTDRI